MASVYGRVEKVIASCKSVIHGTLCFRQKAFSRQVMTIATYIRSSPLEYKRRIRRSYLFLEI